MAERGRRKFWVYGCLAVFVALGVGIAAVAATAWWSIRSADPRATTLVREPEPPPARLPAGPPATDAATPLKLLFELDSCETYIEPAAPGEALQLEAHYDAGDYRLEERVDDANPDAYHVRFLVTSSRLITGIKQGLRGGQPQLRIRLPVDRPIEFKLVQRNGGAIVDFSGLQLNSADFDVGGALLKVDADAPLRGDLKRFRVEGSQGGIVLESLDLMQPRKIDLDFRMGQIQLDFRGTWSADTEVDLSMSLLDAIVRLPRNARIEGLATVSTPSGPEPEVALPKLTFNVESGRRTQLRVFD